MLVWSTSVSSYYWFSSLLFSNSLNCYQSKLDPKIAETTWVHKLFGGRLRSRVHCLSCGHNSDTFDSILDLSVDILGVSSLNDALRKFVAVDHLKGADKYKCDKFVVPSHLGVDYLLFCPVGAKSTWPRISSSLYRRRPWSSVST